MPVAAPFRVTATAVKNGASKATAAMGAATAARSARAPRWVSIAASLRVLAGAGDDAWRAGAGLVRGAPAVAGSPPTLRSTILSNRARQPAKAEGRCRPAPAASVRSDECGENHDDEDGADNIGDSAVGPDRRIAGTHADEGRAAQLVVVINAVWPFGGPSGIVLGGRLNATRPLSDADQRQLARVHSEPHGFKSGATVRNARGGERGRVQQFQWQLAAAWTGSARISILDLRPPPLFRRGLSRR
jgi:hypothetical protein